MRKILIAVLILSLCCCKQNKRAIVVSKIRKASKLATVEFTIDKTVFASRDKKLLWLIKLNHADFLAYTQAFVKTGIDLNKLQPDDVVIDGKMIRLTLPHIEVLNFSYPIEKYRIDKEITRNAFLNRFTIEDYDKFYQQAEINIRNNLKYLGIIKTTEEKTRLMIESLLKNLGYNEIYIDFKKGELIPEVATEIIE